MPRHFSRLILLGLVGGIAAGLLLHAFASPGLIEACVRAFSILSAIFLRMIKMVIAPLVLATLVGGIAHMSDRGSIARVGVKAMVWFLIASVVSLCLGTVIALLLKPGAALNIPLPHAADPAIKGALSLEKTLTEAFPVSIFEAMANNSILQIVVFSLFAGCALSALGSRGEILVRGVDALGAMMLKVTNYVMLFSPIGVFAAVAGVIAEKGFEVVIAFAGLLASFYAGLILLILILLAAGYLLLGRRLGRLLVLLREPGLLAFSTTSSEAAFPKVLAAVTRFGAPRSVAGFVLPLGYSFNLDASIMYCTFGALFIVQAYGVHLDRVQLLLLMVLLFVASKGIAAVPRGALIAIAATLPHFNVPEAGVLLLLGVDHFMNMGRSVTNVLGNALAVVAVARWEGNLSAHEVEIEDEDQLRPEAAA